MEEQKKEAKSHHRKMIKDFKRRFYISLAATIPVFILSPTIQGWLNYGLDFLGKNYILLGLATFIYIYGGWPFLKGLIDEIKKKQLGMMTLIALAISVAFIYSAAIVFGLSGNPFFWELASLVDIMLLGHWIEMRSVLGASRALEELAELLPSSAHLIQENGEIEDIKIEKLKKSDIVLIKPGEKIPTDGVISDGESYIDESMLTGESIPVKRERGDQVIAGSLNGDSSIKVEVKKVGEESYLAKVIYLVREAQEAKSRTQRFADKAAFWLTIIAISVGFTTFFSWLFINQDLVFAIERMATVMVITCPHALGLAIPLVVAVSTSLSAKNGLLIRNRSAFEQSRKIDVLIFDKTGTLTEGKFQVNNIISFDEKYDQNRILKLASALESNSDHPIAKGIISKAKRLDLNIPGVSNFKVMKGKGIIGTVKDQEIKVVGFNFLKENNIKKPENTEGDSISTVSYVLVDEDKLVGLISLSDQIREDSFQTIKELQEMSIKCWMFTGDNRNIAKKVSKELKIDNYIAEMLPDQKLKELKKIQGEGKFVAMTGDGINDAPALAQANVGIAIGSGTDVAAETADIILAESNPRDVLSLIKFGKATYRKMVQNLLWATGYNIIAIPLAAGLLINLGILISPAFGAILMSLSTVIVAINAKFLEIKR